MTNNKRKIEEICRIYQELIPHKNKRRLWADGLN